MSASGLKKAATVMLLLGEKNSAPLWSHFDDDEVKRLSMAMSELGTISFDTIGDVIMEFREKLTEQSNFVGSYDRTESFLRNVLPREKAEAIIDEIRGLTTQNVWRKLSGTEGSMLSSYLTGEHPQTVALILSRLPSGIAARALSKFQEDYATNVVTRMLTLNSVHKEALQDVESILGEEFLSGVSRTQQRDAHEAVAEVFNALDGQTEKRLMSSLERSNEAAATRIKQLMFTFDDLTRLSDAAIQTMLRGVDRDVLARALKGSKEAARTVFMKNMSTRAGQILKDDIEALGAMRMKDVEQAQTSLVLLAKELEAKGEIMIARSDEDEFV